MRELLKIFLLVALAEQSLQSFCGSTGVPFSFEVLPSGAPVLGCAQPSCVAAPENIEEDSNFLTDTEGQSDGFFREGDKELKRFRDQSARKLIAKCSGKFADLSCPGKDQWVGGIEFIDHPRQPLILQCCSFEGLRFSQDVGVTNVGPGEAITGGEVVRDGRQISFDVIANVRKVMDANTHEISYEVTVRRMNCLPDPPEPEVPFSVDAGVSEEVVKILTKATNGASLGIENKFLKKSSSDRLGEENASGAIMQKANEKKFLEKKSNVHHSLTTAKPEPELGNISPLPEIAGKLDNKSASPFPVPSPQQVPVEQHAGQNLANQAARPNPLPIAAPDERSISPQPQFGVQNLALPQTQYTRNVPGGQQQPLPPSHSNGQANFRFINVAVSPAQLQNSGSGTVQQQQQQQIPQQADNINHRGLDYSKQQRLMETGFPQQNSPTFNPQTESGQSNSGSGSFNYGAASNGFAAQALNNQNTNANQPSPLLISQANVVGHYVYNRGQAQNRNDQQQPSYNGNGQSGSLYPPQSAGETPPPTFTQQTFATLPPYSFAAASATPRPLLPLPGSYGLQQYAGVGYGNVGPQTLLAPSAFQPQPFQASFPILPTQTPASPLLFGAQLLGFPQPGIIPLAPLARGGVNVQQAAVSPARATSLLADQSTRASPQPLPPAPSAFPSQGLPPLPSFEQVMGMFGVRNGTLATLPTLPTLPTLQPFSPYSIATPPPLSLYVPHGANSPLPPVLDIYGRSQQQQASPSVVSQGSQDASSQLQSSAPVSLEVQQLVNPPTNPPASADPERSPIPSRQK
uniref:Warthog protein 1 n=1 Tax=Ascaris suum TaxID=6253 RepID=F1KVQ4_ASCSU